jgi:hypothetical protein
MIGAMPSPFASEPARLAAHALLDSLIAVDADEAEDDNGSALELAFSRVNEVAPLTLTVNEDTGQLAANGTDFMSAVFGTLQVMLNALESATGKSQEELIFAVRHNIDRDD